MVLPLTYTPVLTDFEYFGMGTTGLAVTGGVFFDHRASEDGDLASVGEIEKLDWSWGHSNGNGQYHYHLVKISMQN